MIMASFKQLIALTATVLFLSGVHNEEITSSRRQEQICPAGCKCDTEKETMACTGLPIFVPRQIRFLKFQNCSQLNGEWPMMPNNYSHIETLTISGCDLNAISPSAFEQLISLHHLDLSNNRLTNLTKDNLKGLVELKSVYLSHNELQSIEENLFDNNPKLRIVVLDGNAHLVLSNKTFERTTGESTVTEVSLRACGLTSIPTQVLDHRVLPHLTHLDLSDNDLGDLEDETLRFFPNVKTLRMDRCGIQVIGHKTLSGLLNLKILGLSGNMIFHVHARAFDDFASTVRRIDLEFNPLTRLSDSLIMPLFNNKLRELNVSYTQLECSCLNAWLKKFPAKPTATKYTIRCASPAEYQGMNALQVMKDPNYECRPVPTTTSRAVTTAQTSSESLSDSTYAGVTTTESVERITSSNSPVVKTQEVPGTIPNKEEPAQAWSKSVSHEVALVLAVAATVAIVAITIGIIIYRTNRRSGKYRTTRKRQHNGHIVINVSPERLSPATRAIMYGGKSTRDFDVESCSSGTTSSTNSSCARSSQGLLLDIHNHRSSICDSLPRDGTLRGKIPRPKKNPNQQQIQL